MRRGDSGSGSVLNRVPEDSESENVDWELEEELLLEEQGFYKGNSLAPTSQFIVNSS
jgi:hypothetical protein